MKSKNKWGYGLGIGELSWWNLDSRSRKKLMRKNSNFRGFHGKSRPWSRHPVLCLLLANIRRFEVIFFVPEKVYSTTSKRMAWPNSSIRERYLLLVGTELCWLHNSPWWIISASVSRSVCFSNSFEGFSLCSSTAFISNWKMSLYFWTVYLIKCWMIFAITLLDSGSERLCSYKSFIRLSKKTCDSVRKASKAKNFSKKCIR